MNNASMAIIKKKIDEEDQRAAIFASVCQVFFLCFICVVYLLSPKGFNVSEFEPVKITFIVYSPFVLLRLFLALRHQLSSGRVFFFLAIDVLILTALIWSFHIQYAAPLTLSLRAPTFLYFFVFLALQALSYRPAYILFFLGAFVVAWGTMIGLALTSDELRLTRLFKEYILPDTFILGVEIDKMIAVLLVGLLIAVSVQRKLKLLQRLAERFVKEAALESLIGRGSLSSFNLIEDQLQPGQVKTKVGATLTVDLRGFSALSYIISPAELLTLLGQYQRIVAQHVLDCGGVIDKYLGDGVLAHFGVASELPTYAASALKAADLINRDLAAWTSANKQKAPSLGFGLAVTHGEVVFGVIGHPERMEVTVIGESVNRAAKLEKHTKRAGKPYLVDAATLALARSQGYHPVGEVTLFENVDIAGLPTPQHIVGMNPV